MTLFLRWLVTSSLSVLLEPGKAPFLSLGFFFLSCSFKCFVSSQDATPYAFPFSFWNCWLNTHLFIVWRSLLCSFPNSSNQGQTSSSFFLSLYILCLWSRCWAPLAPGLTHCWAPLPTYSSPSLNHFQNCKHSTQDWTSPLTNLFLISEVSQAKLIQSFSSPTRFHVFASSPVVRVPSSLNYWTYFFLLLHRNKGY